MLDVIKDTLELLFISFGVSFLFAPFMIGILYRYNQVAEHKKNKLGGGVGGDNSLYLRIMNVADKNGTPNMGGILVWIVVPLLTFLLVDRTSDINIFILAFALFGFWGFLDVLFTNMIKNNHDLKAMQEKFEVRLVRFVASVLINLLVTYLLYQSGRVTEINLWVLSIAFTPLLVPLMAILGQFAIYASEITDGLDGLMIGIFGIIYTTLAALLLIQGQYQYLPVIGIVMGTIIIDLYFNIPPARFYNGGPSAMPLGLGAFYIGLVSNNLIPYFAISSLTWIIMGSSLVQILSMKFFKKRVFKIAPLHHHFQAVGWPEYKVTMRFWLATMVVSIVGLYLGVVI